MPCAVCGTNNTQSAFRGRLEACDTYRRHLGGLNICPEVFEGGISQHECPVNDLAVIRVTDAVESRAPMDPKQLPIYELRAELAEG